MDVILEQINSAGKVFVSFAWPMLIQSSVLIVVLFGLDLVLRNRIRAVFRYWMWMIVLVKLLLPTTLASPTSPAYWFRGELSNVVTADLPIASPGGRFEIAARPAARPPAEDAAFQPTLASSVTWQGLVFLAWLAAVVIMTALLLQRALFVRGLVAQSEPAGDAMMGILGRCCKQMRVSRKVALRLSPGAASPSVCGLLGPTILLPASLADRAKPQHLKSILLHELAHIKRGDLWVSFVQTVVQIIYLYNPLLWVANAVIRRVREQAVDETVLVVMGHEAEDYPRTLLHISRLACGRTVLSLQLIGVVESKKSLIGRIKHITSRPFPRSAKMGIRGFLIVVALGAALLPMAKGQKPAKEDVSAKSESEEKSATPLHEATAADDIKQVKSLIAKGADVNAKDKSGWTPLHSAANAGHKDVAELLLVNGAYIDAKDERGRTPLHHAAAHGHKDVANFLIDRGASLEVTTRNKWGLTPLHTAAESDQKDMVQLLIAKGADMHGRWTALHFAAWGGATTVAKFLIDQGADVNARAGAGLTPLHRAAQAGHISVAELLLAKRADVNAKDIANGCSALHWAAYCGQSDMAEFLLNRGADLEAEDIHGNTPLHTAVEGDAPEVVELLVAKGAQFSPIHIAAYSGDLNKVEVLLSRETDANEKAWGGFTPLHSAACGGQIDVAKFLISKGADVNAKDSWKATHLHYAAQNGHKNMVGLLVAKGAEIDAKDTDSWAPLHYACWRNHENIADFLLVKGADLNARTKEGQTPLAVAKKEWHTETIELLRKHGAQE